LQSCSPSKETIEPRHAYLTSLYDVEQLLIDQAIMLYSKAPRSFTGVDVVEFQCHGGVVVAQKILDVLQMYGACLAQPGEFTKRAFLGKIDLTEAEAIGKLIEAKSAEATKILARRMKGELRQLKRVHIATEVSFKGRIRLDKI